ncbi:39S ribosomal protein L37, mitochondrial [Actinomortierella ambigua]|nr:39S ribosomal protein L37, mitochondrial [Actinomortierella ambigua]
MSLLKSMSAIAGLRSMSAAPHHVRCIHVSLIARAAKDDPASPAPSGYKVKRVASSAPEGTVLKGLNYMKDGKDPVAQPDEAYPDWLWEINDPEYRKARLADPLDKKHHKEIRRQAIKASNFLRDKKT